MGSTNRITGLGHGKTLATQAWWDTDDETNDTRQVRDWIIGIACRLDDTLTWLTTPPKRLLERGVILALATGAAGSGFVAGALIEQGLR